MSVSSTTNRADFTGNGAAFIYPFTFPILDEDDLRVVVLSSTGVETTLTIASDYTVSGVGDDEGGNVTLVNNSQAWLTSGMLSSGYTMTIRRLRPVTQTTDISNQSHFYPEVLETAFDHGIMIAQQQQEEIDRSVKLPASLSSAAFDPTLPTMDVDDAGKVIQVNDDGDGLTLGAAQTDITGIGTSVTAAAASATASAASASAASGSAVAAAASAASAAVDAGAVLYRWGGTVAGTANDITLTPSPALSAYVTGNRFVFVTLAGNTGASTVAVSGLAAKALTRKDGTALQSGDLTTGLVYTIVYDGTRFRMIDPAAVSVDHGALTGLSDDDHPQYIKAAGASTIADVRTFSSFPITPSSAPTTDFQVANKAYVDTQVAASGATVSAWKFVETLTLTGTSQTSATLPTDADLFLIVLDADGAGGGGVGLRFNGDSGANYDFVKMASATLSLLTGQTSILLMETNTNSLGGTITFDRQTQSIAHPVACNLALDSMTVGVAIKGRWVVTSAITTINLFCTSGALAGGKAHLFKCTKQN
jgi:hypothetical protein